MSEEKDEPTMESAHQKNMKALLFSIDSGIGERISQGVEPTVLIANNRVVEQLIDHLMQGESIDWSEPITLIFGDGEVPLRVFRSMDVKGNQLIVL